MNSQRLTDLHESCCVEQVFVGERRLAVICLLLISSFGWGTTGKAESPNFGSSSVVATNQTNFIIGVTDGTGSDVIGQAVVPAGRPLIAHMIRRAPSPATNGPASQAAGFAAPPMTGAAVGPMSGFVVAPMAGAPVAPMTGFAVAPIADGFIASTPGSAGSTAATSAMAPKARLAVPSVAGTSGFVIAGAPQPYLSSTSAVPKWRRVAANGLAISPKTIQSGTRKEKTNMVAQLTANRKSPKQGAQKDSKP